MVIGYSTGTFDMLHRGHFELLVYMKKMCDTLIIGLTSDKLAEQQKRQTIIPYEDRKSVLENCKWVDLVVMHDGDDKKTALKKIHFDVLFIGDDYYGKEEYSCVEDLVKVVYVPRSVSFSTTKLVERIERNFIERWSVLSHGVSGTLYCFDDRVIKPIHVGYTERNSCKDVYNIAIDPPRNWRGENNGAVLPNISGVNANRELKIQDLISEFDWCTYISHKLVSENDCPDTSCDIFKNRSYPSKTYWLIQKKVGLPLSTYWSTYTQEEKSTIINSVKLIIEDLRKLGIIHGDIHTDNILIDSKKKLYLIDFGWCAHPMFGMGVDELLDHQKKIEENWDLKHFENSIKK